MELHSAAHCSRQSYVVSRRGHAVSSCRRYNSTFPLFSYPSRPTFLESQGSHQSPSETPNSEVCSGGLAVAPPPVVCASRSRRMLHNISRCCQNQVPHVVASALGGAGMKYVVCRQRLLDEIARACSTPHSYDHDADAVVEPEGRGTVLAHPWDQ